MSSKKENKILIIISIVILCMPIVLGLAYKYRSELKADKRFTQIRDALFTGERIEVKIQLIAGINDKDMRVMFNIPCKDLKTKQGILDNMARIKHELLMSMDNAQNKTAIERRDFKRIKSNCLAILKRYSSDVNEVYVDFFAHN